MGQNMSDSGAPPMTVGMSRDVFDRINSERRPPEARRSETDRATESGLKLDNLASKTEATLENPASGPGVKLENPVSKSYPCDPEKPRRSVSDVYLKTPKIHSAGPGSGRKNYSEYWERSVNEERAFRESIDKVLEAEKRRWLNDVEDLLPPLSDTGTQRRRKACSENFTQVTRCYQENSSRPLVCSGPADALFSCFRDRANFGGRENQQ